MAAPPARRIVVGIDSNSDPQTAPAFEYRDRNVYRVFEAAGFEVVRLGGALALQAPVQTALTQAGIVCITGVGHGDADTFLGNDYNPVFEAADLAAGQFSGQVIHLLSCKNALTLGPSLVHAGCRSFFGYAIDFTYDPAPEMAKIFFDCDSEIDRAVARGDSDNDIFRSAKDLFSRRIAALLDAGETEAASRLEENRDALRLVH